MSELVAPVVATDRLELVPLSVEHAAEMASVLGDSELHEFVGGEPLDPAALRARFERLVAGSGDPDVTWLNWVIRSRADDCLVGTVQATVVRRGAGAVDAEIAWVVGRAWQGQGFAKEAAAALVGYLREAAETGGGRVTAVRAHVHPEHNASAAVARAAGLHPTDRIDDGEVRWELTS